MRALTFLYNICLILFFAGVFGGLFKALDIKSLRDKVVIVVTYLLTNALFNPLVQTIFDGRLLQLRYRVKELVLDILALILVVILSTIIYRLLLKNKAHILLTSITINTTLLITGVLVTRDIDINIQESFSFIILLVATYLILAIILGLKDGLSYIKLGLTFCFSKLILPLSASFVTDKVILMFFNNMAYRKIARVYCGISMILVLSILIEGLIYIKFLPIKKWKSIILAVAGNIVFTILLYLFNDIEDLIFWMGKYSPVEIMFPISLLVPLGVLYAIAYFMGVRQRKDILIFAASNIAIKPISFVLGNYMVLTLYSEIFHNQPGFTWNNGRYRLIGLFACIHFALYTVFEGLIYRKTLFNNKKRAWLLAVLTNLGFTLTWWLLTASTDFGRYFLSYIHNSWVHGVFFALVG